jgi:pimeloyl-ACP methyl ester carboxylesterase
VRRAQRAPAQVLSQGLHAATLCADAPALWPGAAAAPARVRAATLARLRTTLPAAETAPWPPSTALDQGLVASCRAWPAMAPPPAPPRDAEIRSPALLLAGDHDLSTPLEWAREEARLAPKGKLVVVHGASHSVQTREQGDVGKAAVRDFLLGPATA